MQIEFARIDALSAAAVRGLSAKPVIIIDIVLNWMMLPDEPLKVIRLRSDTFNPSKLFPDSPSPLESIRAMLDRILESSGATPLPDPSAARGQPFASFESLEAYQRTVLMVD